MSDDDNIFDCIDLRLKSEEMYKYIEKHLSSREKKILVMRYGLFCTKPLTQREVADQLNISRSYVSQHAYENALLLRNEYGQAAFQKGQTIEHRIS